MKRYKNIKEKCTIEGRKIALKQWINQNISSLEKVYYLSLPHTYHSNRKTNDSFLLPPAYLHTTTNSQLVSIFSPFPFSVWPMLEENPLTHLVFHLLSFAVSTMLCVFLCLEQHHPLVFLPPKSEPRKVVLCQISNASEHRTLPRPA